MSIAQQLLINFLFYRIDLLTFVSGGGYPRGRVIEIFGQESSGKTTLALHAVAEVQRAGGISPASNAVKKWIQNYTPLILNYRHSCICGRGACVRSSIRGTYRTCDSLQFHFTSNGWQSSSDSATWVWMWMSYFVPSPTQEKWRWMWSTSSCDLPLSILLS